MTGPIIQDGGAPAPLPFLEKLDVYVPGEQPSGGQYIKLNTNEFPYEPAPGVVEAIAAESSRVQLYPNPSSQPLREALAERHGVDPTQVFVGNGSDEVLRLLMFAYLGPGRRGAIVEPTYSLYEVLAAQAQGRLDVYPLEGGEHLPRELFTVPWDMCVLPVPNPPLGTVFPNLALCKLAENPGMLVIDGAYLDFWPGHWLSAMVEDLPHVVVTRTFSKSYGLAGMRVGYAIAHPKVIETLDKLRDSYNVSRIGQAAALAALGASDYYSERCARIIASRDSLVPALRQLGFRVHESQANFVFARHPKARAVFEALKERKILVRYFDREGLRDGMRITIGTEEETVKLLDALKAMRNEGVY